MKTARGDILMFPVSTIAGLGVFLREIVDPGLPGSWRRRTDTMGLD